ncbi:hypothetical protein WA026_002288 [Henosepilachna vigintioctopunctata]|uniref:Uncharacterized protein n=1 Tax=Henosepilachna vigintioctopunctata TaxID=420089 RepID=A0AAW1TT36_9CUCU
MALDEERKIITILILSGIVGLAFSLPAPEPHHSHHYKYKEHHHYRSKYRDYQPYQPFFIPHQPLYGGYGHGGGVASAAAAASVSFGEPLLQQVVLEGDTVVTENERLRV